MLIEPIFVKVFVHASRYSKPDTTPVHITQAVVFAVGVYVYAAVLKSHFAAQKPTEEKKEAQVDPDQVQKLVALLEQAKKTNKME